MWKYYALLSAFFAALTAIFAKVGVKDINFLKEPVSPRVVAGE